MGSPSPLFLLLLFLIWIYLLPWGKKRDIWLLTLLITLCPIKLPSLKAFVSAISSTKIPSYFEEALNHPTTSTGEESYNRRNGGSKEERHLGTGHVTKRQTYGWLQVGIYPETQSGWLYREGSSCGERFHTNLWHRLSRDVCSCGQTKLNSVRLILSVAAKRSWPLHCISWMSKTPFFMETSTNRFIWVLHQVFELRGRKEKKSLQVKKDDIWSQAVSGSRYEVWL